MTDFTWKNIAQICKATSLDDEALAAILKINVDELRCRRELNRGLRLDEALRFGDKFNICIEHLVGKELDASAACQNFFGTINELPARYQRGKLSKFRSLINLFEGIKHLRGEAYLLNLLRATQLPRTFFDDPDKTINVLFLTDFLNLLKARGWSEEDMRWLGQYSSTTNRDSTMGLVLSQEKRWRSIYETFVEQFRQAFDKNYDYRLLSVTDDEVLLEGKPSQEAIDCFHTNSFDTELTCVSRMGVISSASSYSGLSHSHVTKIRSVHSGHEANVYRISKPAHLTLH